MLFWGDMTIGTLYFSRRAKEVLVFEDVQAAIERYEQADWGDITRRFAERNPRAVVEGAQVVGFYRDRNGQGFWIITEPKHEETLIKLADEPWDVR